MIVPAILSLVTFFGNDVGNINAKWIMENWNYIFTSIMIGVFVWFLRWMIKWDIRIKLEDFKKEMLDTQEKSKDILFMEMERLTKSKKIKRK